VWRVDPDPADQDVVCSSADTLTRSPHCRHVALTNRLDCVDTIWLPIVSTRLRRWPACGVELAVVRSIVPNLAAQLNPQQSCRAIHGAPSWSIQDDVGHQRPPTTTSQQAYALTFAALHGRHSGLCRRVTSSLSFLV